MNTVDLLFPVSGDLLATDHKYLLYSALSHVEKAFHTVGTQLRFAPINGERGGKGLIRLAAFSRLRLRLPAEQIPLVLPLAGRDFKVGEHSIHLGMPTMLPLTPAPTLRAKVVTFKLAETPSAFLQATRRRLDEMGIGGEPGIPLCETGRSAGEPRRQVIWIKGATLVGFPLHVEGLTAEESLRLQERGLGGHTRMGCGFFVPFRVRES
jgi:CRISPR-associated protein Cas6